MKKAQLYGNYTRGFAGPLPKFQLWEERDGELYRLLVANVTAADQGLYTCRVQEIRRHRNIWRASSNGTAATRLTVHYSPEDGSSEGVLRLFADVYLCAVLICSLGLLSIFLFTLVLTCQYLHNRHRRKASYLLVKCPESSSGETVTSSVSSSGSSPRGHRKEPRQKPDRKLMPIPIPIPMPRAPRIPEELPPYIHTKAPVASQRPRKPRRLKAHARRSATPKVPQDDSLTYAELELVRPRLLEPPATASFSSTSSSTTSSSTITNTTTTATTSPSATTTSSPNPDPVDSSPDTVYAQILFQERQL